MINERRNSFARSIALENLVRRNRDLKYFLESTVKPDLKLKGGASNNSQVNTPYYTTKNSILSKKKDKVVKKEEEVISSISLTTSDFATPIIHNHLSMVKGVFEINLISL